MKPIRQNSEPTFSVLLLNAGNVHRHEYKYGNRPHQTKLGTTCNLQTPNKGIKHTNEQTIQITNALWPVNTEHSLK